MINAYPYLTALLAALQAVTLTPGDAAVNGVRLTPGTSTYAITMTTPERTVDAGTMSVSITQTRAADRDAWQIVHAMNGPAGTTTDTVQVDARTLAPIAMRGSTPAGTIQLKYNGAKVTGEHRDPEGSAQAVDETLSRAPFDANTLDMILASLPLASDYAVNIPMYLNELGLSVFESRVEGDTTVANTRAWRVRTTTPEGTLRTTIAQANGLIIGETMETPSGMRITMTLRARSGREN